LRPYQVEVARAIRDAVRARDARTLSVQIARQGGKNELSAQIELLLLLARVELARVARWHGLRSYTRTVRPRHQAHHRDRPPLPLTAHLGGPPGQLAFHLGARELALPGLAGRHGVFPSEDHNGGLCEWVRSVPHTTRPPECTGRPTKRGGQAVNCARETRGRRKAIRRLGQERFQRVPGISR